jgi:hypothetical protein
LILVKGFELSGFEVFQDLPKDSLSLSNNDGVGMLFCLFGQKTWVDAPQYHFYPFLPKLIGNGIGPLDHTGQTCNSDEININVKIDLFNHLVDDPHLIIFRKQGGKEGETQHGKRISRIVRKLDSLLSGKDEEDFPQLRIAEFGMRIQI